MKKNQNIRLRPSMGLLGFLGFMGCTYFSSGQPYTLVFFSFFGFFSYYWWGKLGIQEDERLTANRYRASHMALSIAFPLIFVATVLISVFVGAESPELSYALLTGTVSLSFALALNIGAYLTYRYDQGE